MRHSIINKEIIKGSKIINRILDDIEGNSKTESLALFQMVKSALEHNNFAEEIVIVKTVEIEGLRGLEPCVFTKWQIRQKNSKEEV